MSRSRVGLFLLFALAMPSVSAFAEFRRSENRVPNRYIVRLADDFPASVQATAQLLGQKHGAKVVHVYEHAIKGFAVLMPEAAAIALSRNPLVVSVTEDAEFFLAYTQSNAHFGLDRIDQRDLPVDGLFHYTSEPGRYVQIYVIDTGVNLHNDIAARVILRKTFASGSSGDVVFLDVGDCWGHGTSVASVAAGDQYGVAKAADIISVKVFSCEGQQQNISDFIAGINYVVSRKIATPWIGMVMNLSFASLGVSDVDDAVLAAVWYDITVVAAAGNWGATGGQSGGDACSWSPAHLGYTTAGIITVAASDTSDTKPLFSNFGSCVDMFAPGTEIHAASPYSTSGYVIVSGTSFAAPLVAGEAARRLGFYNYYAPATVEDIIKTAATPNRIQNTMGSPNLLLYVPPLNDECNIPGC